jgi:hypothetical protein
MYYTVARRQGVDKSCWVKKNKANESSPRRAHKGHIPGIESEKKKEAEKQLPGHAFPEA